MKKIALVLVASIISVATFAQRSAIDKVANAACDCINATEFNNDMTSMDAEMMLGQCMAPSIMENMDALMKEMNLKEFNQESGYQIGIEVGKKLGAMCPKFIELSIILARNANSEDEITEEYDESGEQVEEEYTEEDAEIGILTGRYVREEGGDLFVRAGAFFHEPVDTSARVHDKNTTKKHIQETGNGGRDVQCT